jgi:hypothetical protein
VGEVVALVAGGAVIIRHRMECPACNGKGWKNAALCGECCGLGGYVVELDCDIPPDADIVPLNNCHLLYLAGTQLPPPLTILYPRGRWVCVETGFTYSRRYVKHFFA